MKGYPQPDGTVTFEAERPVSRAEMAALVARILEKKLGPTAPADLKFADASRIPGWAKKSVGVAVAKGIVGGYPNNTFQVDKHTTRAEMAAMIFRLLKVIGDLPVGGTSHPSGVPAFPDLVELKQPDGTSFLARQWGDERLHGWETAGGYTIVKEEASGFWCYAQRDEQGRLVSTGIRVNGKPPADIVKHLRPLID